MTEVIGYTLQVAGLERPTEFFVFYRKWEDVIASARKLAFKYNARYGPILSLANHYKEMECNVEGYLTVFSSEQIKITVHAIVKNNEGIEFDIY